MTFDELFAQVCDALQREQRISYRALRRRFELSDDDLEDLKDELIYAKKLAVDEENRVILWVGNEESEPTLSEPEPTTPTIIEPNHEPHTYTPPHLAEKILTSRSALEGERKQVTVLFCDLANSTAIAERIGPEHMHTLLNRFFERALSEVHRFEGTINQFLGDGFMALFGAPIAHEDHARRAVLAALGLQRGLQEAELGKPYGVEYAFRMGLNSGLVVVGSIGDNLRMDYSAIGDTTNLASRLQTQAEPGNILIHETTARLVQGYIRLEALAPVEVRGKTEPVSIYKVISALPRRSPIVSRGERTLSQFVGRERELATLDELFAQVESGQGQVVGIIAEAGQGKSRLLYEFRQRLIGQQITYLEGRCLSYGQTIPYHPIIDILRHNCDIRETDTSATIAEKVRLALQKLDIDPEDSAPYLFQLLGITEGTASIASLTPEAVRTRTFETLRQMSLKGSQRQPLIFEIEDLHWVDQTSEAYLASLVESLVGAAILLLTTYRPGYHPQWLDKSYATQISLHSLARPDALDVVHAIDQDAALPERLEQTIIAKAEGNPFFLEELTRAVIEHGDVQSDMVIPDTIQGVLSARIDRLPESHKQLLQTASVLGRAFSPTLLKAIWQGTASLEPLLLELKRLEFLFERSGAEESIFVFRHALTQDVAYESLLTTRRQALHGMAAQALEVLYAERLDAVYNRLAYHYTNADNAVKAVEYLSLVAEKAVQSYAHTEAVTMLQEALVHAERLPEAERDHKILDLTIRQTDSLFVLGRRQELVERLLSHQDRLKRLQDPCLSGVYYNRLGRAYSFLGIRQKAIQSLQHALEEGRQCGDAVLQGSVYASLALEYNFAGNYQLQFSSAQQAVSLLDHQTEPHQLVRALSQLGGAYHLAGHLSHALETAIRICTIGDAIGDRRCQAMGFMFTGRYYAGLGEWATGIDALQQALALAPDAFDKALISGYLGYAYLEQGTLAEALPVLEQAVHQTVQYRGLQVQGWFKTFLAEAYGADGQTEAARDLARQALALAEEIEHPLGIGLAQRALGRIAHASDNLANATSHLQEALITFDAIQARYELARTHLDLASLAHTQGNPDSATTHLSTAYTWFKNLQVSKWAAKTEQFAQEYGVTLAEVEMEVMETESTS